MGAEKLKAQKKRATANRAREARARIKDDAAGVAEARASNRLFRCPDADELTGVGFPREAMRLGFAVKVIGKPGSIADLESQAEMFDLMECGPKLFSWPTWRGLWRPGEITSFPAVLLSN